MDVEAMYREAKRDFDAFYEDWFVKKGGLRTDGVVLARRASDAIEPLWEHTTLLSQAQVDEMDEWLEWLQHVPEIEKDWFGLAEYRRNHRVERIDA